MDEPLVAEAAAWMHRAEEDLRAAVKLIGGDYPLTAVAVYHCQQAAEKALKAVLVRRDVPFSKTHDLRVLLQSASDIAPGLAAFESTAEALTPFATEFRYPTGTPDPGVEEAREAVRLARELLAVVQSMIV